MIKTLSIELYVDNGIYHAFIEREEGDYDHDCAGITPEICASQVKSYVKSLLKDIATIESLDRSK